MGCIERTSWQTADQSLTDSMANVTGFSVKVPKTTRYLISCFCTVKQASAGGFVKVQLANDGVKIRGTLQFYDVDSATWYLQYSVSFVRRLKKDQVITLQGQEQTGTSGEINITGGSEAFLSICEI